MRYTEDGFDLDMTYTSPRETRVLTLGFPATGLEHAYRNPRLEVSRYLEKHHDQHYKIFNLCCEPGRHYDADLFQNRVERWPFRDHCVPPLETMLGLSNSVKKWIDEDPKNMVAIHCKAGKGRAGIMTCIVLLRLGYFDTAEEAMNHYDSVRVTNKKGLTVKSQRRSVYQFEKLWREVWNVKGNLGDIPAEKDLSTSERKLPEQPTRKLKSIRLKNIGEKVTISSSAICQVCIMTNWTESEDVLIFQTCGIFGILSSRFLKAVPSTPCSRLRLGFLPKVKQSVVVMMHILGS